MVNAETPAKQVEEEHRELEEMFNALSRFLEDPQPGSMAEGSHIWAGDLAERLVRIHHKLFHHVREEEERFLKDIAERHPETAAKIQALCEEHDNFLAEIREIVSFTMIFAEDKQPDDPDLRDRTRSLLNRMGHHRRIETDYIMRLHWEDIGGHN